MDDKRLFLLDAYALIYRAYYGLIRAPRITSKGFNTSAIFGFVNTLDEILRKENPTHIAVCFDPPGGQTFRHEMFDQYKAQRQAQPEDITLAIPYIKRIIAAYNIPIIEIEGYEADDVIGTLAKKAEAEGFTTYMMTPDKDYGQLVTDRILMYRPSLKGRDFEIRGPKEVCERYGLSRPSQVIDLLALEGDASDNIPGCPGVGEKTAVKLLAQYGSVEEIIANAASIKGAMGQRIAANVDNIRLSKTLATICTDVPVEIDPEQFVRKAEDAARLRELFVELEFKTFLSRLGATSAGNAPSKVAASTSDTASPMTGSLFDLPITSVEPIAAPALQIDIAEATTATQAAAIVEQAVMQSAVGLSVYAPGADAMTAPLRGIALAWEENKASYISFGNDATARSEIAAILQPLFAADVTLISHDVKRDMVVLRNHDIRWESPWFDTSVAHYLLQPEMRHRLSELAQNLLGITTTDATDTVRAKNPYPEYTPQQACRRNAEAAAIMIPLRKKLTEEIVEQGIGSLLDEIELPLIPVLAQMEIAGVRIDVDELRRMSQSLTERIHALEAKVYEIAGREFNIGSPRQVGEVLFVDLAIDPKAKRTKTGAYSTTEEILESYRADNPIVDLILQIRTLSKLLDTYVNSLPTLINPRTGKIHTTFNQTVTATGRLSSANPNLQNIPVRSDDGREIRRAFIADPGHLILSADYSQIELRLMAERSGDPGMIQAFAAGQDIHAATAAKIYHLPIDQVTDTQRRNAKTANFGIIYGISAFGLSQRLGISRAEAKSLIDGYFQSYPTIARYIDSTVAAARADGYVTTIAGRRRYLPEINSRNASLRNFAERNAVNAPLQGSAADIIKVAMIRIHNRMTQLGMQSKMILQVHDELIFDVVPAELAELQQIVITEMTHAHKGEVTLEVSSGVATNWLEAH